jgi:glycerol-3-phosphate dehydrogenase
MFALFFSLLLAQATPASRPSAAPSDPLSGWIAAAPASEFEYRRYVRHEPDGTDSILTAARRVCDCRVDAMQNALARAFAVASNGTAVEKFTDVTACGQDGEKLVVSGLATPANRIRNAEIIAFRDGDAFVTLSYTFRYASPMLDAENALAILCPPKLI